MSKGRVIEQITSLIEETTQENGKTTILHDVSLEDKLGISRQIDVLIEYKLSERTSFKTAIECKLKGRDGVEINQMLAFVGTLDNFPDIHQGIFVSTNGFQAGAVKIAKHNNIKLYNLKDLTIDEVKTWFKSEQTIRKTVKNYNVSNWRILLNEKDRGLLSKSNVLTIKPDDVLEISSDKSLTIREVISAIAPIRANELHNHLLEHSINGLDVYKEKYVNISIFPLVPGTQLITNKTRLPVTHIELKIVFWFELEEAVQAKYKLYTDQDGNKIANILSSEINYDGKNVILTIVEDIANKNKGYYFIDGNKRMKLEIDKEFHLPEKNQTTFIMKKPTKM